MIDSWLQSGMNSEVIATAFIPHTDMSWICFFLGCVCSGGQFTLANADKPSLKALQELSATHVLVSTDAQLAFDWTAAAGKVMERTVYTPLPTVAFCDAAIESSM